MRRKSWIDEMLSRCGKTRADLGEALHCGPSKISRLATGKQRCISRDDMVKMAEFLRVSVGSVASAMTSQE